MRYFYFILILFSYSRIEASNEWIINGQRYFRIDIFADGMYRLNYATLQSRGIPVDEIPSAKYRLFYLGEEVDLYSSNPGIPGPGDYLEFFGQQNRGGADSLLFDAGGSAMLNPHYSLFTDTSAYFLTWGPDDSEARYHNRIPITDCPGYEWTGILLNQYIWYTDTHQKTSSRVGEVNLSSSRFDQEGFAGPMRRSHQADFTLKNQMLNAPDARLELRLLSNDNPEGHHLEILLNNRILYTEQFTGSRLKNLSIAVPSVLLSSKNTLEVRGRNAQDYYAIGTICLTYAAQKMEPAGQSFVPFRIATGTGNAKIDLFSGSFPSGKWILLDTYNKIRYKLESGGPYLCLDKTESENPYLLFDTDRVKTINQLHEVHFEDFSKPAGDYVIITHSFFLGPDSPVEAYAQYRSRDYKPVIVNIDQLYDSFAFGIRGHPLAIRNFIRYIHLHWQVKYILIIGKGLEYPLIRKAEDREAGKSLHFVPGWGSPPSDQLLAAGPGHIKPLIPIGRLAVTQPHEIYHYLNKVKDFEAAVLMPQSIASKAWLKKVLHLSGGSGAAEQNLLKNYLYDMGMLLSKATMGAELLSWSRIDSEGFNSAPIFAAINGGLAMITFLGHAAPGSFDVDIDNPERYANKGRYPFMLSLGCYSGNLFTPERSLAEKFCFMKNTGAIAFAATSGPAFLSALNAFGRTFYQNLGKKHYGQGLGYIQQQSIGDMETGSSNIIFRTLLEQFTFHGDPALRLHPFEAPDYMSDPAGFSIIPSAPSLQDDSLQVCIKIRNLGKAVADTLNIEILLRCANLPGSKYLFKNIPAPANASEICFPIPIQEQQAGNCNFSIVLQPRRQEAPLPEAFQNNRQDQVFSFTLFAQKVSSLNPTDAAIVTSGKILLQVFAPGEAKAGEQLILEIDTTPNFNSPLYRSVHLPLQTGLLNWEPEVPVIPEQTYFWRHTTTQNQEPSPPLSFTCLSGHPEGWLIKHPAQITKGIFRDLSSDTRTFGKDYREIRLQSHPGAQQIFSHNGQTWAGMWIWEISNLKAGVQVLVMNPEDGAFILNQSPGLYGSLNNFKRWPLPTFAFDTGSLEGCQALVNFLSQQVPEGHYVLFYTGQLNPTDSYAPEHWDNAGITNLLKNQGAELAGLLSERGALPYIFYFQKDREVLYEALATDSRSALAHTRRFPFSKPEGSYLSPPFGPAAHWGSLHLETLQRDAGDRVVVSLEEPGREDKPTLLVSPVVNAPASIGLEGLQEKNPSHIQVSIHFSDSLQRSPAGLQSLKIIAQPLPDLVFSDISPLPDTLRAGQNLIWRGYLANSSPTSSDSLRVRYRLRSRDGTEKEAELNHGPVPGSSRVPLEIVVPLKGRSGQQTLRLAINPDTLIRERNLDNNHWQGQFYILSDSDPPIIEASMDGKSMVGKTITGARPLIQLRIRDAQLVVPPKDTPSVKLFLRDPRHQFHPIPIYDNPVIQSRFSPGEIQQLSIYWSPEFAEGGDYAIRVEVEDGGTNGGNRQTAIFEFSVLLQPEILECWTYPNPFSQSTRFVTMMGGHEALFDYHIRIFTVSGRFVRELTAADLGPIEPGLHLTEFSWDGTDNFGDPLASGLYFYRIYAEGKLVIPGDNSFFHRGTGKLVILR